MEQSALLQESLFIQRLDYNGVPVSAFAAAPARSVNSALMERLACSRCHQLDQDGRVQEVKILGTSTHQGQLVVCIPLQAETQAWSSAGLVQTGRLMHGLGRAIQEGKLSVREIDFARLRLLPEGCILLCLPVPGSRKQEAKSEAQELLALQYQLALRILAGFSPDSAGNFSRQASIYMPVLYQGKYRLNPSLRQFLTSTLRASPGSFITAGSKSGQRGRKNTGQPESILAKWQIIARILSAGKWFEQVKEPRRILVRFKDSFGRRLYAAGSALEKFRMPIIAGALALVFAAFMLVPAIQNKLRPPLSAGMTPETLVIHFFMAVNELDVAFVDSVLAKPSASPFGDSLYAMAAVNTIRTAAEGSRMLMPPEEAAATGPAELTWGAEKLVILSLQPGGEEKMQARVQYTWHADGQTERREDLITLVLRKGNWIIQDHQSSRVD